jgi:high-affinity nickel-transport protein
MRAIDREWKIYPVGVLFGLGFDTATEVLLLTTTAYLASERVPWQAILALPILFMAGMTLADTTDGVFMNLAYGWAFFNPVRKVYYNLAITGLSVAICFFIGGVETIGVLPLHGGVWTTLGSFNINTAGFVIVGMFVATWIAAALIWRYGRIEEKWSSRLAGAPLRPAELTPAAEPDR